MVLYACFSYKQYMSNRNIENMDDEDEEDDIEDEEDEEEDEEGFENMEEDDDETDEEDNDEEGDEKDDEKDEDTGEEPVEPFAPFMGSTEGFSLFGSPLVEGNKGKQARKRAQVQNELKNDARNERDAAKNERDAAVNANKVLQEDLMSERNTVTVLNDKIKKTNDFSDKILKITGEQLSLE